jgi:hypothetical protein
MFRKRDTQSQSRFIARHMINQCPHQIRTVQTAMSAIALVATARACASKPRPQIVHPHDVLTQHNRGMRRLFTRRTFRTSPDGNVSTEHSWNTPFSSHGHVMHCTCTICSACGRAWWAWAYVWSSSVCCLAS